MFGFRYVKSSPSTHLIVLRGGRVVREGSGLALLYFAPLTSLISIPMAGLDAPFAFRETSRDFQDVTVQGQATFRVVDPQALARQIDFTLAANGVDHATDDPQKLQARLLNAIQVQVRTQVQRLDLHEALTHGERIEAAVGAGLREAGTLAQLGIALVDLAILAIRPTPETARALEADVREQILKRADDAMYARRNAAIEQERAIRENELQTEIAVETKQRQIREAQLDAERAVLDKRQQIERQEMAGRITLEESNGALVDLQVGNGRKQADARADAMRKLVEALGGADPRVLQALTVGTADPGALIAMAFQGLAENAGRIGELNISPDLLQSLTSPRTASRDK